MTKAEFKKRARKVLKSIKNKRELTPYCQWYERYTDDNPGCLAQRVYRRYRINPPVWLLPLVSELIPGGGPIVSLPKIRAWVDSL